MSLPTAITIRVDGDPVCKGSMRAWVNPKTHRAIVTASNPKKQRGWSSRISYAAQEAMGDKPLITGAVHVALSFRLRRPKGHYGTGRNAEKLKPSAPAYPILKKDDLDKLERCALDALTGVVWVDDGQVVNLDGGKRYADHGEAAGVAVSVVPVE